MREGEGGMMVGGEGRATRKRERGREEEKGREEKQHLASFLALLLSPCWPMMFLVDLGRYLSTHIRLSAPERA